VNATLSSPVLAVLSTLLEQRGQPITTDTLARTTRQEADQVRTSLRILSEQRCVIEPVGVDTVQLVRSGESCWEPYLRSCHPESLGLEVHRSVTSTQDIARDRLEQSSTEADGFVVLADHQTRGRGRRGRRWTAPPGTGVLLSRVFVFPRPPAETVINHLIASSAVAVAGALEAAGGPRVPSLQIRWPNDLVVNHRKLAGILVEGFSTPDQAMAAAIVGVGVNVTNSATDLQGYGDTPVSDITSFRDLGILADRLMVAKQIVTALDAQAAGQIEDVTGTWRQRCVLPEGTVRIHHDGKTIHGRVLAADPSEGLVVHVDGGGIRHLPAASTSIERPAN